MECTFLEMPQEEAKKQVRALKTMFKNNRSVKQAEIYKDMQKVYGHINNHGGKVIDVYETMKYYGLDEMGFPKIAICRADGTKCYLWRRRNGSAIFSNHEFTGWNGKARKTYGDIELPENTFPRLDDTHSNDWSLNRPNRLTIVPMIPALILIEEVKHSLKNYFILWEVEEWAKAPIPPKDPILLKQLTSNLFGVLATWDLTEIERAILKSHILSNS